ncbi:hypothetical protein EXIGLDRAFT_162085 [Exidia glandulosa HHB12029]|uniref:MYND-type domain-containing protein n=1 Tax=Exidia glandulosa HHB12029 TaxID=1314781 RepID=A0A165FFR2_EXIGL|nr:hypothetical protein EXIGLDRAFT_162085 [Exidia glandulosa HHB12029]
MSWPSKDDNSDYRSVLQYLGRACLACGARPSPDKALTRCSRCRRARYCGVECQKIDYAEHKGFCSAYSAVKDWTSSLDTTPNADPHIARADGNDGVTPWQDALDAYCKAFHRKSMNALLASLGPKRTKIANYLGYLVPRCLWCYRSDAQRTLAVCERCNIASWCAESECETKGRTAHEGEHCDECIELVRDDEYIRTTPNFVGLRYGTPRVLSPSSPAFDPSSFPAWSAYIQTLDLPGPLSLPSVINTIVTRQLSLPLTILAALQRFGILAELQASPVETLTIHLIGAERNYELIVGALAAEEILHVLPGVKTLEWFMVGPSMGKVGNDDENIADVESCPECEKAGRKRRIGWFNKRYQSFAIPSNPDYRKPHLAIGFNSGMHERPQSWGPVLDMLYEQGVPSVFTSYSLNEAKEDAHVVEKSDIPLMWKEERNLWRGERKQWDWFVEGGMWWENGYWMGFKGTKKA